MNAAAVVLLAWSCLSNVGGLPHYFGDKDAVCPAGFECVAARLCPSAVSAITSGGARPRRCGFRGFDELVCCEGAEPPCAQQRPPAQRPSAQRPPAQRPAQPPTAQPPTAPPARTPTRPSASTGPSASARACQRYRQESRNILDNDVIEFKINGGDEADISEFPYIVAIGFASPRRANLTWNCAGSLISERYVLTAAHCITDTRAQNMRPVALRAGATRVEPGPREAGDYGVESVVLHPRHDAALRYDDLALVRADRALGPAAAVRPVCLPGAGARPEATAAMLLAAGWGAVDPTGFRMSPVLKKVQLRAVAADECTRLMTGQQSLPRGIDDSMLCATGSLGNDTCRGDSGGPLVMREADGDTLVGVTSFGGNPCGGRRPGVYARTANAIQWIESVVWA